MNIHIVVRQILWIFGQTCFPVFTNAAVDSFRNCKTELYTALRLEYKNERKLFCAAATFVEVDWNFPFEWQPNGSSYFMYSRVFVKYLLGIIIL